MELRTNHEGYNADFFNTTDILKYIEELYTTFDPETMNKDINNYITNKLYLKASLDEFEHNSIWCIQKYFQLLWQNTFKN